MASRKRRRQKNIREDSIDTKDNQLYIKSPSPKKIKLNKNKQKTIQPETEEMEEEKFNDNEITVINEIEDWSFSSENVIEAKILRKGRKRFTKSTNYLDVEIGDQDGDENIITLKCINFIATEIDAKVSVGDVVQFKQLTCIPNTDSYDRVVNPFQLRTTATTSFKIISKSVLPSLIVPTLQPIEKIKALGAKNKISFVGFVTFMEETKVDTRNKSYKWIRVVDEFNCIFVKLYNDAAKKYTDQQLINSTVLISFGEISEFRGRSITVWEDFVILNNKDKTNNKLVKNAFKFDKEYNGDENQEKLQEKCDNLISLTTEVTTDWTKVPIKIFENVRDTYNECRKNQKKLPYTAVRCKAVLGGYYNVNKESNDWYYSLKKDNKKLKEVGVDRYYNEQTDKYYGKKDVKKVWNIRSYWTNEVNGKDKMVFAGFDGVFNSLFGIQADSGAKMKKRNPLQYRQLLQSVKNNGYIICIKFSYKKTTEEQKNKNGDKYWYSAVLEEIQNDESNNLNEEDIEDY